MDKNIVYIIRSRDLLKIRTNLLDSGESIHPYWYERDYTDDANNDFLIIYNGDWKQHKITRSWTWDHVRNIDIIESIKGRKIIRLDRIGKLKNILK